MEKNSLTRINSNRLNNIIHKILPKGDYVKDTGFFLETLASFNSKVALIHIDSDLYSSFHEILNRFFSQNLISNGCCIMFDDYDLEQADPNGRERRAWVKIILKYQMHYSSDNSSGLFTRKFITQCKRKVIN